MRSMSASDRMQFFFPRLRRERLKPLLGIDQLHLALAVGSLRLVSTQI